MTLPPRPGIVRRRLSLRRGGCNFRFVQKRASVFCFVALVWFVLFLIPTTNHVAFSSHYNVTVVVPVRSFPIPKDFFPNLLNPTSRKVGAEEGQTPASYFNVIVSVPRGASTEPISNLGGMVTIYHTASQRPTYKELVNEAIENALELASLVLVLSPTHVPRNGVRLVEQLLQVRTSTGAAVVGCTVTLNSTTAAAAAADRGRALVGRVNVLEHGFSTVFGYHEKTLGPFLSRNFVGFDARDSRSLRPLQVDAVGPYCVLAETELLLGSFDMAEEEGDNFNSRISFVDFLVNGQHSLGAINETLARLYRRFSLQDKYLQAISLSESRKTEALKAAVHNAYVARREINAFVQRRVNSWEALAAIPLSARAAIEEAAVEAEAEKIPPKSPQQFERCTDALREVYRDVLFLTQSGVFSMEEERGWDLSLFATQKGHTVVASGVHVEFDITALPRALSDAVFSSSLRIPLFEAAFPLTDGPFAAKWGRFLSLRFFERQQQLQGSRALSPAHSSSSSAPPVRLVWDAFCCRCCGFSTELMHFLHPLQRQFPISLVPGDECFCPGFPLAVSSAVTRSHIRSTVSMKLNPMAEREIVVWIAHTDPTMYPKFAKKERQPDYFVGRSMTEFSSVHEEWAKVAADDTRVDEIWVPSQFVKQALVRSGVPLRKLQVIAEGVDVNFYDPALYESAGLPPQKGFANVTTWCNRRAADGRRGRKFSFLSSFKWEERKGWDALFRAFFEAFSGDGSNNVELFVVTHRWFPGSYDPENNPHNVTFFEEQLEGLVKDYFPGRHLAEMPRFCLLLGDIQEEEMVTLYRSASAFVLPTRGEGWGLPLIQAMAMELPTVATEWGGHTDFMNCNNSFLIPIDEVTEIDHDSVYYWQPGKKWAIPSVEATAVIMRRLVAAPASYLQAVGREARRGVVASFSEEAVAAVAARRLADIRQIVAERRFREEMSKK